MLVGGRLQARRACRKPPRGEHDSAGARKQCQRPHGCRRHPLDAGHDHEAVREVAEQEAVPIHAPPCRKRLVVEQVQPKASGSDGAQHIRADAITQRLEQVHVPRREVRPRIARRQVERDVGHGFALAQQ